MPGQSIETCRITPEDELKLRWYFGGKGSLFQPSPQAERCSDQIPPNIVSFQCPVCDGDGYLYCGGTNAKKCSRCEGEGRIERSVKGVMVPRSGYVRCQACRGVVSHDKACPFCHGEGYAPILAAFCLHTKEAVAYVDADAALFSRQGEVLRAISQIDDQLREYSERYYGPEGDRWARTTRGRIFCLYDFTAAGRRLLSKSPRAHKQLTRLERIGMLAEADKKFPDRTRTELLANAYLQAHELLDQFTAAWSDLREASNG
jgi:hypothetical protein